MFGATGTIGWAVRDEALRRGHDVRALVRDASRLAPADRLEPIMGDARDASAVSRVVRGMDAVVSAIGPRTNTREAVDLTEQTARNIVAAMLEHRVPRLLFVAGAGISLPGETRTVSQHLAGFVVRRIARWVVAAKERETEVYRSSGVPWVAVRPTRVMPGPATGRVRTSPHRPGGFRVTSGDLSVIVLDLLATGEPGSAPFVWTA